MKLEDIRVGEKYLFTHKHTGKTYPVTVTKVEEKNEVTRLANELMFPDEDVIEIIDNDGEPGLVFATELTLLA